MNGGGPDAQLRAERELKLRAVWCGYYDGNERSHRVQEKLGFIYHHTTPDAPVPQLNTVRAGHVSRLTREHYNEIYGGADTDR